MPNARLQSHIHFHFIVFIFGFTAILGELISLDAISLVWYRMGLASLLILGYIGYTKIPLSVSRKEFRTLFIAGTTITIHWVTFFAAIKVSNVAVTLAVLSSGALFTAILEPIFYKRKFAWYELLFGILVIVGLTLILDASIEYTKGILLALLSAIFISIFALINGKLIEKHRPSVISLYELATGWVLLTLYLIVISLRSVEITIFDTAFFSLKFADWGYLFVLASVCTAYAFIVAVKVMKHLNPFTIMLTNNLEPIYGIVLAYFIFGEQEQMNMQFYIGAAIILLTVISNGVFKMVRKRKIVPS